MGIVVSNNESSDGGTYYEANLKYFPNSRTEYYGNDLNEAMEKVEVHYCKTCRLKRVEWLRAHSRES